MSYNVKIQRCITANWKANFETKFANWGYSDKRPLISDVYPEIVKVYSYDDFFGNLNSSMKNRILCSY